MLLLLLLLAPLLLLLLLLVFEWHDSLSSSIRQQGKQLLQPILLHLRVLLQQQRQQIMHSSD